MLSLRPYQSKAIEQTITDLKDYDKLGIIAPTGAGKTIIMMKLAEHIIEKYKGSNVIIVSHLSVLQTQTLDNFTKWAIYKTDKYQGRVKPSPMTRIIVSTMQTLRRRESADLMRRRLICNDTC